MADIINDEEERARQKARREAGKPCQVCGHPEGAHQMLGAEELDEPVEARACRFKACACAEFR